MNFYHLKRIGVNGCGPITSFNHRPDDFNVYFGNNEAGKTFLLDSLLYKMGLLSKKSMMNISDERHKIVENANITLEIKNEKGKLVDISKVLKEKDIANVDFQRIFVVRNNDLEMGQNLDSLSEKLTGSEVQTIKNIAKNIKGEFLTDGLKFKITTKNFVEKSEEIIIQFEEDNLDGYSNLERDSFSIIDKMNEIKNGISQDEIELKKSENILMILKHRKMASLKKEKERLDVEIEKKKIFSDKKDSYIETEREIKNAVTNIDNSNDKIKELEKRIEKDEPIFLSESEKLKASQNKLSKLKEIKLKYDYFVGENEKKGLKKEKFKTYKNYGLISLFFSLIIVSSGLIVKNNILTFIGAFLFLVHLILTIIIFLKSSKIDERENREIDFLKEIREQNFEINGLAEFSDLINKEKEMVVKLEANFNYLNKQSIEIKANLEFQKHNLEENKKKLANFENDLYNLKQELEVKNFNQLKAEIEKLEERQGEKNKITGELTTYENIDFKDVNFDIEIDNNIDEKNLIQEIKKLSENISEKRKFQQSNEYEQQKLEARINEFDDKVFHYDSEIKETLGIYNEIEGVKTIDILKEYKTYTVIKNAIELLKEKRKEVENIRNLKIKALGYLDEIEEVRREKINTYFGEGKEVSRYFEVITEGRYRQVDYEDEKISILDQRGNPFSVDVISQGTYDQLFFSIRLNFGKEFLGNTKGFFLLDDPFLAADDDRFENGMNILKKFTETGWQILYFSVQTRVKNWCEKNNISVKNI